jgi:hypothetical protein
LASHQYLAEKRERVVQYGTTAWSWPNWLAVRWFLADLNVNYSICADLAYDSNLVHNNSNEDTRMPPHHIPTPFALHPAAMAALAASDLRNDAP